MDVSNFLCPTRSPQNPSQPVPLIKGVCAFLDKARITAHLYCYFVPLYVEKLLLAADDQIYEATLNV